LTDEDKVVSVQAMKAYERRRSVAPHVLNLDGRWRLVRFCVRPL
jgi:hypothetical protein